MSENLPSLLKQADDLKRLGKGWRYGSGTSATDECSDAAKALVKALVAAGATHISVGPPSDGNDGGAFIECRLPGSGIEIEIYPETEKP